MTLRLKLTISFLLVSLTTAAAVGGTAWWMLMRDFRDAVRERAFENFREDVMAYIGRYGSWEEAQRYEAFPDFANRQRRPGPEGEGMREEPAIHRGLPPFRFVLIDPDGRIVKDDASHKRGELVSDADRRQALPIVVGGQEVLYALPIGEPNLTLRDRAYLTFMKRALLYGLAVAAAIAILLGILFGGRLVVSLKELTAALRSMRPDGEIPQPVRVRSHDEIGLLAEAFNRMSKLLAEAHRELQISNNTISAQTDKLREQSRRDPLTGLYNRRHFDERALELYREAVQQNRSLCVMIADLDHFKSINDSFSHAVGDTVLRRTAAILQGHIDGGGLVARYGGEEFVALFSDETLPSVRRRCEAIRREIENGPWEATAADLHVTVSIGLCDNLSLGSTEAMLRLADEYLYKAKHLGRNRVEPQS